MVGLQYVLNEYIHPVSFLLSVCVYMYKLSCVYIFISLFMLKIYHIFLKHALIKLQTCNFKVP